MATQTNDLRAAADAAAQQFTTALTGFLLVVAYLCVTLTQISDADFLTGRGQTLPIIGSSVPTEVFFWVAPALLLILHLGLLLQWKIYHQKVQSFVASLAQQSAAQRAAQIELLSPSMVTAYLVPGSQPLSVRWAAWSLTVVVVILLPLTLLLGIEVRSLAFHLPTLTQIDRVLVLFDLAAVWIYFPAVLTSPWATPARAAWVVISALLICYVCFDAVVPAQSVQSLDNACKLADFRRTCNLTDRWLRKRRVDVAGQTLQAKSAPDSKETQGLAEWLNLEGADLRFGDFSQATLSRAALYGAQFQGAHLSGTRFLNSAFQPSGAPKASWEHAITRPTSFEFAYATLADFTGHDLHEVTFRGAVLAGADFTGCNLLKANFTAASLEGANFQAAYLLGARLDLTSMIGADLRYAVLSAANLRGADLRGALLYRNPLFATTLDLADLSYASAIALGPDELTRLRKKTANIGTDSTTDYRPQQMIDLLSGSGQQLNLQLLLVFHGNFAWLMNFDYLPISPSLVSSVGEPLSTADYVRVLQAYIHDRLHDEDDLRAAMQRRPVLEQLLVPTIIATQKVLLIGEPNSPPVQQVRDSMIDRLTRLQIVGVGKTKAPDSRFAPWATDASSDAERKLVNPPWLEAFLNVLVDPSNSRDTNPSSLMSSMLQPPQATNTTSLAIASRLAQMYEHSTDTATRQALVAAAEQYQPDAQTLVAIASLTPKPPSKPSPTWLRLMQLASSQSGEAAGQLGVATANDDLIRQAATLGNVRAAAAVGQTLYIDPESTDSIKRGAWQSLAYAAYRGDINAQLSVGTLMSQQGDDEGARRWLGSAAAEGDVDLVDRYAYFLATCPDATYRDPASAIRLAAAEWRQILADENNSQLKLTDIEKTRRRKAGYSTLAASYAAGGDFPEAIAMQGEALALVRGGEPSTERTRMEYKLTTFRDKRPWLEYPVDSD